MCDIDGLLTTTRTDGRLEGHKKFYAKDRPPIKDLGQIVKELKPTVNCSIIASNLWFNSEIFQILIGASATPGLFTTEILQDMAKFNKKPIIFALSNPTSRAECTAEQAFTHTDVITRRAMRFKVLTV